MGYGGLAKLSRFPYYLNSMFILNKQSHQLHQILFYEIIVIALTVPVFRIRIQFVFCMALATTYRK